MISTIFDIFIITLAVLIGFYIGRKRIKVNPADIYNCIYIGWPLYYTEKTEPPFIHVLLIKNAANITEAGVVFQTWLIGQGLAEIQIHSGHIYIETFSLNALINASESHDGGHVNF